VSLHVFFGASGSFDLDRIDLRITMDNSSAGIFVRNADDARKLIELAEKAARYFDLKDKLQASVALLEAAE